MSATNALAAAIDPRPITPVGFAEIRFRRVLTPDGLAPDWVPSPTIVARKIPGSTTVRRYNLARGQDTVSFDVELESTADAAALRALVGTSGSLTLPHARYDDGDYGTALAYPDGLVYRTQSVFLAAIGASSITIRQTVKVSLSFERDPR